MVDQEGRGKSLSIFFPAYNDWGTIASMVLLAARTARSLTDDFEVIVVNDASPDHTGEILEEMRHCVPNLKIVTHSTNKGYGGALRSGFSNAAKEWVFYTDGDAQYDVRELRLLWEARQGADVVNGYKIRRSDPWYRAVVGRIYHHTVKILFRLPIRDVDCDFRLIHRSVFERFDLKENSGLICVELMAKIAMTGCRIVERPVHHYHRMHGKSQFFNFRRVARVLLGMIRLWWNLFVRKVPLKAPAEPVGTDTSKPEEQGDL